MSACGQTPDQSKLAKLGRFDSSSSSRENILWTMLRGLCLNTKTEYRAFHQLGCFMRRRRKRRRRRRSVSRRVTRGTHSSAFCHSTTSAQPFSPIRNYFVKPSKRFCKSQLLCPIIVFSCPVQFSFQLFNCLLYLFILINVEPGTRVGCCQMRGAAAAEQAPLWSGRCREESSLIIQMLMGRLIMIIGVLFSFRQRIWW